MIWIASRFFGEGPSSSSPGRIWRCCLARGLGDGGVERRGLASVLLVHHAQIALAVQVVAGAVAGRSSPFFFSKAPSVTKQCKWTTPSGDMARIGISEFVDEGWTHWVSDTGPSCADVLHLYCFEARK
jgi:hypothetical protein